MSANDKTILTLPFVIQKHHVGRVFHWDLMLHRPIPSATPDDRVLATWQITVEPVPENLNSPIAAKAIQDHRLIYLTFEGPISQNRGRCEIVDRGQYDLWVCTENLWRVHLMGLRLTGTFELKKNSEDDGWTLAKWEQSE
jgi:hypothetical protein